MQHKTNGKKYSQTLNCSISFNFIDLEDDKEVEIECHQLWRK